jgi:hypothetical protein
MLHEAAISHLTGQEFGETYTYFRGEFLKKLKEQGLLF